MLPVRRDATKSFACYMAKLAFNVRDRIWIEECLPRAESVYFYDLQTHNVHPIR